MVDQSGGDNITIRTMKDDMKSGAAPKPAPAPQLPASPAPPVAAAPAKPASAVPPIPATAFPLPPRTAASPAPAPALPSSQTVLPYVARRNRRRLINWLAAAIGSLLLIAGGVWAFVAYVSVPSAGPEAAQVAAASVSEVLPASTGLAVHYRLQSAADRSRLLELWNNSPKTLFQGNPKTLLTNPNVDEFMYVGIPGESRPFLVIPEGGMSEPELAQLSASQVAQHRGWHILHALNAAPYTAALAQGAGISGEIGTRLNQKTGNHPLDIYLSDLALTQIRSRSAGEPFAAGAARRVLLSAGGGSSRSALVFEGISEADSASPGLSPAVAPQFDQALLAQLPADVTFARLGHSLSADIAAWQTTSRVLDKAILDQPAVAALVRQMATPYALYRRLGLDGVPDVGLLAQLPPSLNPPLALGDVTLEAALPAILPLVPAEKPVSKLTFADGLYQQVPLRFVNVSGAATALDYAVQDQQLRLATSKEGMFAALDVAGSRAPSLETGEPWKTLLAQWGAVPSTGELLLGYLDFTSLVELLPSTEVKLPAAVVQENTPTGLRLSGVILVDTTPSPAASTAIPVP